MAGLNDLRDAIADTIAQESAYEVARICESFGLAPQGENEDPWRSKRVYIKRRLASLPLNALVDLTHRILDEYDDAALRAALVHFTSGGVSGSAKNLIFAADGPKPDIVLSDAVNNDIRIVRNAQFCLIYDEPIGTNGLSWGDLSQWWAKRQGQEPTTETRRALYNRLLRSMSSPPEELLFETYYSLFREHARVNLPALIPQVYLHYDPFTMRELNGQSRLPYQRMDFLVLLHQQVRIVIEIDGQHHYADGAHPSPRKYGEMMKGDRELRLRGYEVYRFGGAELTCAPTVARELIRDFFTILYSKHKVFG